MHRNNSVQLVLLTYFLVQGGEVDDPERGSGLFAWLPANMGMSIHHWTNFLQKHRKVITIMHN